MSSSKRIFSVGPPTRLSQRKNTTLASVFFCLVSLLFPPCEGYVKVWPASLFPLLFSTTITTNTNATAAAATKLLLRLPPCLPLLSLLLLLSFKKGARKGRKAPPPPPSTTAQAPATHIRYLSSCSARSFADALASKKRESTSSMSPWLMTSRPAVAARILAGVSIWTA